MKNPLLLLLRWALSWPRSLLSAVVVVIVFVVLGLSAWAGVMLAQDNDPAVASTAANECGEMFGGPYPFGGLAPLAMKPEEMEKKQADFERYEGLKLSFSHTLNLTDENKTGLGVFETSVKANSNASRDTLQQKYNYVITNTKACDILVAAWNEGVDLNQIGGGVACAGGGESFRQPTRNKMINWAPEEPYGRVLATKTVKKSPCWLDADRKIGILDAISKHFMLAQYPIGEGEIREYNREAWAKAQVAYAGEILVDLKNCTYIVTENSGTYRPNGKYRAEVNNFFAAELGRNSRKISNVSPWCP